MIALAITLILSAVLCGLYLRLARRWRLLDHPNQRSSHHNPTPHSGGVPLLLAFATGVFLSGPWGTDYQWLVAMTLVLMVLGVVDDLRGLSSSLRFALYSLLGVATATFLLRSLLQLSPSSGMILAVCFAFALVWALNLYNFMDGIDGLAATQCLLACVAAAWLSRGGASGDKYALFCLLLAASHLGFLVWNWAPARLFMGDAGSVPTGFLLAGLAGFGAITETLPFACWAVLLAAFITDASYTLAWRIATGQDFTQAHKLHAYQKLSRHWRSHRAVVVLLAGLNIFWLIPIAWAAQQWPEYAFYIVILAYIPLVFGMVKVGKLT